MPINKARYWVGVLYPENMKEKWTEEIGDVVQVPYAYCIHGKDKDKKSEHRKDHVHLMLAFPNTTTYKHAMAVFSLLSAQKRQAVNTIQAVVNVRSMYDYLIHDTETCKKQGKELYDKSERITGNNFDIGAYEQLSIADKNEMTKELCLAIMEEGFTTFGDFFLHVVENYEDSNYFDIVKTYSGLFERLTRSNYQKLEQSRVENAEVSVTGATTTQQQHSNTKCCPSCGSISMKKFGKTAMNRQRWMCKDCGKTFM